MSVFDEPPRYRSYLLTFWEERGREPDLPVVWRFSLSDPHTGQRRAFATLGALIAALEREMDSTWTGKKGPGHSSGFPV